MKRSTGRPSLRGRTRRHTTLTMTLVGALAAISLAACGSSDSGGSGGSDSSSSEPKNPATGSTVDVWTAAPIGTAGASAPQRASGVKAAFQYLNDHGGLGAQHHKVTVKVCNTQLTPQGEIQCGQQAASDPKTVAVVAPIVVISTGQFMSDLEKAGLADVNPTVSDASQATSPVSFPLGADNLAPAGCAVMTGQAVDAKSVGLAGASNASAVGELKDASAAVEKAGMTPLGPVTFPITTTDVTPFFTQLSQKDPDATVLIGSPQNVGQWLAAQQRLGKSGPICTSDALTPPQVLIGLGANLKSFYTAASFPDPSWDGYPMLKTFRSQAEAAVAAGDKSASLEPTNGAGEVLAGWMGAQAVIQAAAKVSDPLTRKNVLDALNHTTVTFGEGSEALIPPVDFSKPNPNPSYPRVFNTTMFLKQWDPSTRQFKAVTKTKPVDVSSLIP